ncbi:MAG: hypothetical protein Kow00117_03900 [Phototrophicales bacterium]|nr:MAG: hypothetical protein CUN56_04770 [Phototrophicales bacterium]RMG72273.1 MAG: hypothetical protein D6711_13295 [Chloroflexota bacterium]
MRKLTLLILVVGVLINLSVTAQSAVTLSVASVDIGVGESATISVSIDCTVGCAAADVTIQYDPSVIQVANVNGGDFLSSTGNMLLPISNQITGDQIRYAAVTLNNGNPAATGNGTVFTFQVTGLTDGTSSLNVVNAQVTALDGTPHVVTSVGGTITVGTGGGSGSITCYPTAPAQVVVGQTFDVALHCDGIPTDPGVYGVQICHTLSGQPATALNTQHVAGSIFAGKQILDPINNVTNTGGCYGASLVGDATTASGNVLIASAQYQSTTAGQIDVSLQDVILVSRDGTPLASPLSRSTQIEIIAGSLASLEGDVRRQAGPPSGVSVLFDGINATTITPIGNLAHFVFNNNLPAISAVLVADAPGHLSCEKTLTLTAGANTMPSEAYLLAGDVNNDNTISIIDSTAVGLAFSGSPDPGMVTDLNGDGVTNVIDLVFVGNNYNTSGPTACY